MSGTPEEVDLAIEFGEARGAVRGIAFVLDSIDAPAAVRELFAQKVDSLTMQNEAARAGLLRYGWPVRKLHEVG